MGKSSNGLLDAKPRKSIKLTPGRIVVLTNALADLRATYGGLLASLSSLTPQQQAGTLAHSPILADLKALTDPLRG